MFNFFSKTDMQIQQDVINKINWDSSITSFQLTVDVHSIAELNAAGNAAWIAPGILTVENNLQISQ